MSCKGARIGSNVIASRGGSWAEFNTDKYITADWVGDIVGWDSPIVGWGPTQWPYAVSEIPWYRQWLGDRTIEAIWLRPDCSDDDRAAIEKAFPEATIDPPQPLLSIIPVVG